VKAIETKYKGYRFRSRLEARWAVFFDACGYKWEYEPEGFDLDGSYYLPDFKIYGEDSNGDFNVFWVEIKPTGIILSNSEAEKIRKFSEIAEDVCRGYGDFIVIDGPPTIGKMYKGALATDCSGDLWVMDNCYRDRPSFWGNYYWFGRCCGEKTNLYPYNAALSKRFEHGEIS